MSGRQVRLDEFFMSDEEQVVEVLKRHGGRVVMRGEWDRSECLRLFGMEPERLREVLLRLRRQGVAWYGAYVAPEYCFPHTTVTLTPRFRRLLVEDIAAARGP